WWNSEYSWDGAVLQSSIDEGLTWQNVGNFNDPNNWYNDNSINGNPGGQMTGWSGRFNTGSGGWVVARNQMPSLAGKPSVRLRIAFGADGSIQDDGFAFDDVRIAEGPVVNLGPNRVLCVNDSIILDGGAQFTAWRWNTAFTDTNRFLTVTQPGIYVVRVTDTLGFFARDTVEVVGSTLSLNLGANPVVCLGESYTFDAGNPGSQYLWNTGDTTQTITVSQAGTYFVQVRDTFNCIVKDTVVLNNYPQPIVELGNDTSFCVGTPFELNAGNNVPNCTYLWSTGSPTQRLVVTGPGTYSVLVTSPDGCNATDTISLNISLSPSVNLGLDQTACEGVPVVLDAGNPGATYQWSNGQTGQIITVTGDGTFSVIVRNATGCIGTDTVVINRASPIAVSAGSDVVACGSATITAVSSATQYLWSNGSTNPTITITQPGTNIFVVQANQPGGCPGYDTVLVTIEPEFTADFLAPDTVNVGQPVTFADATLPIRNYTYLWAFGDGIGTSINQNPTYTYNTTGVRTVTMIVRGSLCA
ncbi:MAG: PKD domain-containing protein, partial [Bacteroidia bacterium]|nr:PKD domain-containing protein [Bacteroidia bacterium]